MNLEKERSHEIWKELDDGFGSIHLNVTMCTIKQIRRASADTPDLEPNFEVMKERFVSVVLINSFNKSKTCIRVWPMKAGTTYFFNMLYYIGVKSRFV